MNKFLTSFSISLLLIIALFASLVYLEPLRNLNWGKIEYTPASIITVTGEAKSQEKNQIASFSAGVDAVNDDKQVAIDEVNQKMTTIIEAVKKFGIAENDIKTENQSIYQQEDSILEEGRYKSQKGQWRVNNSISVKLRDSQKASELTSILSDNGATNVYGPNFTIEETNNYQQDLLSDAIEDAREKAEKIAEASNRKLGKVISVTEGYNSPIYPLKSYGLEMGGGGGAPLEPGSSTVSTSVTVVFDLK